MKVYKPKEFAEMIGVSVRTLIRWDASGVFKAYRTPTNQKYYTQEQYIEYYSNGGVPMKSIEADILTSEPKPKTKRKRKTKSDVLDNSIGSEPSEYDSDGKTLDKNSKDDDNKDNKDGED